MTAIRMTCDETQQHSRAAVWQGKELIDLYVDRKDRPDLTGAIVRAKVVRVAAGGRKAWLEAGLAEHVYVEGSAPLKTGAQATVLIRSTLEQGKAWAGKVVGGYESEGALGLLVPPPPVWVRALADRDAQDRLTLAFENREEHKACEAVLEACGRPAATVLEPLGREKLHPELDEKIEQLLSRTVSLQGGGTIVIDPTEALIAIDVNGTSNPLSVNLAAVREVGRQIRLRNLSGIIIVDILKMPSRTDSAKVMNALERVTASDPAGVHLFGVSKLGLLEMTRTRRGPSLAHVMGA